MESKTHHDLVLKIDDYVKNIEFVVCNFIACDIFEYNNTPRKMPEGYFPDLFYEYKNNLIIGEAKTELDFDREHSINQYKSYLNYCDNYSGNSIFILAVPWNIFVSAKRLLKRLNNGNSKIIILIINDAGVIDRL